MDKENECICKTCEDHCECELHKQYEDTYCNHGENPISACSIREKKNEI